MVDHFNHETETTYHNDKFKSSWKQKKNKNKKKYTCTLPTPAFSWSLCYPNILFFMFYCVFYLELFLFSESHHSLNSVLFLWIIILYFLFDFWKCTTIDHILIVQLFAFLRRTIFYRKSSNTITLKSYYKIVYYLHWRIWTLTRIRRQKGFVSLGIT